MIFLPLAFYQHVVNIVLDIPPNLLRKHFVHKPLVCRARIFQAEWYYFITEKALAGYERSFLLVSFVHSDLVVTRESIHKAQ